MINTENPLVRILLLVIIFGCLFYMVDDSLNESESEAIFRMMDEKK